MRFVELLIEHYAGAELHDAMNSFTESYNNEAVVKALAKYKEFVDKGYFPEGFVTIDPNDTMMALFSGRAAMDIQGQWYDGNILQEEQDISNYSTFAFPSGGTNRMSAFAEMTQFNVNNTPAEMEAGIRFMDYYYSEEVADRYSAYYTMPRPFKGAKMPAGQPNVERMMEMSSKNSTFTITDQAFPTQVADVLFRAQDAIAYGQMTPETAAANIQKAIEDYLKK
jgi:raffinose/stachyose/melibiose transport system substrate-binding protein